MGGYWLAPEAAARVVICGSCHHGFVVADCGILSTTGVSLLLFA